MANSISFWAYGEIASKDPYGGATFTQIDYSALAAGVKGVPANSGVVFHPLSPGVSFGGVTCNAVVEVLPTGLNVHSRKYATDSTVAQLITAANA